MTPPRNSDPVHARRSVKTLQINGMNVSGTEDQTILEVAKENGIEIPTLCHLDGLSNIGACRICLVELASSDKLVPACVTLIDEGMEVITESEQLTEYRRKNVELLLAERNHICAVCVSNGDCELQDLAEELGVDHVRYPYKYPELDVDSTHEDYAVDHNRCVACQRCLRVCDEVEGAHTWDMKDRGARTRVVIDMNQAWGTSNTCTACGKCVSVCPTGALLDKGSGVAEMEKDTEFLPYLQTMREEE
ncbi:MAG: bidirectional hydrogenase complex protein HoxU [Planctomycetota bacterium]